MKFMMFSFTVGMTFQIRFSKKCKKEKSFMENILTMAGILLNETCINYLAEFTIHESRLNSTVEFVRVWDFTFMHRRKM